MSVTIQSVHSHPSPDTQGTAVSEETLAQMEQAIFVAISIISFMFSILPPCLLVYYASAVKKVGESIRLPSLDNNSIRVVGGDWHLFEHEELGFPNKVFERLKNILFPCVSFHAQYCYYCYHLFLSFSFSCKAMIPFMNFLDKSFELGICLTLIKCHHKHPSPSWLLRQVCLKQYLNCKYVLLWRILFRGE